MGLSDFPEVHYPLFVFFVVTYQVTLEGNGAILLAIGMEKKLRTPMYYFLANLSLVDIFCPSATVPKMLDNLLTGNHSISFLGCVLQFYFLVALVGTEVFLFAVMAYDRRNDQENGPVSQQGDLVGDGKDRKERIVHLGEIREPREDKVSHGERPLWREEMDGYNLTTVTHFILTGLSDLPEVRCPLFVVFAVTHQVTLVGNGAILFAIGTEKKLHTPMYYFLASLSLLDIFCPSATVPKMLDNLLTGNHSISFLGCALQLYFLVALAGTEVFLLAVMAYDRYVAICFPLRYTLIMTKARCAQLAAGTWAAGFLHSLLHTVSTFCLSFCKSNRVNQYYCDVPPVVALSCSSTYMEEMFILVVAGPHSLRFPEQDKAVAVFYTILTPLLNPYIYSLRNKDVIEAVKRLLLVRIFAKEMRPQETLLADDEQHNKYLPQMLF
ncbi:Olfactory Receptor 5V1 [Manis pentadactyla]|nr:Olfactory Receptor 5V1 [Manis pentadactyla]